MSDRIAAACWASTARVRVSAKRAAIVSVEVIRRDPLASPGQLHSPLLHGVARAHSATDAHVLPLPDRSTVIPAPPEHSTTALDDPPMTVDPARATRGAATKRTGTRTPAPTDTHESSAAAVVPVDHQRPSPKRTVSPRESSVPRCAIGFFPPIPRKASACPSAANKTPPTG